jgi:hypothetical protein
MLAFPAVLLGSPPNSTFHQSSLLQIKPRPPMQRKPGQKRYFCNSPCTLQYEDMKECGSPCSKVKSINGASFLLSFWQKARVWEFQGKQLK